MVILADNVRIWRTGQNVKLAQVIEKVVGRVGIEPTTNGLRGLCGSLLNQRFTPKSGGQLAPLPPKSFNELRRLGGRLREAFV